MRLAGFGGFGLEALDETLSFGDVLLLVFVGRLLDGAAHLTLVQIEVVVAAKVVQLLVADLHHLVDHPVQELPVVAYQHEGSAAA